MVEISSGRSSGSTGGGFGGSEPSPVFFTPCSPPISDFTPGLPATPCPVARRLPTREEGEGAGGWRITPSPFSFFFFVPAGFLCGDLAKMEAEEDVVAREEVLKSTLPAFGFGTF